MPLHPDVTVESLNRRTGDNLPGWFGLEVVDVDEGWLAMEVVIKPQFLAPNGYLRGGGHCSGRHCGGLCNDRSFARRCRGLYYHRTEIQFSRRRKRDAALRPASSIRAALRRCGM